MRFVAAEDPEAVALRVELAGRAFDTDAAGLMTANLWLWAASPPEPDPRAAVSDLFAHPGLPCRDLLEPHAASGPWVALAPEPARAAAVRLLTTGASLEVAAFAGEPAAAGGFADRVFV